LRIALTTDTVGSVWTYALDLAGALVRAGAEVLLLAVGPALGEHQRREALALPRLRLEYYRGALEWMEDPWPDVDDARRWLSRLVREHRVAVVHSNTLAHTPLDVGVPTVVVGHACVSSWFEAVHGCAPPPRFDEYRRRVRTTLRAADVVVAPSRAMLDALDRHHGPLARVQVIPHGRDLAAFRPRRKLPIVFAAGRLGDEGKNIAGLARACAGLPWPLHVAGEPRHPVGGVRAIEGARVLGRLSPVEIARWLGRAAIFAAPARYQRFGLGVLEAAAAGCSLVLGDIPSLRETWGDAACFVPPRDERALHAAIGRLIADPHRRNRMANAARWRALGMTPARMGGRYLALYRDLVNPHPEARA
jgi:glycosyltransferase involved in cell wall biosynthesis